MLIIIYLSQTHGPYHEHNRIIQEDNNG